jgi:hypothetical protein
MYLAALLAVQIALIIPMRSVSKIRQLAKYARLRRRLLTYPLARLGLTLAHRFLVLTDRRRVRIAVFK